MSFAHAGEIAASFTKFYYELLTKADSAEELSRLYGDNSCVNFIATPNATTPVSYQGKTQIANFLTKMQETLGERKVNVRHVDYVAADTSVAVTCSGYLYTRMVSRVFSQTFVLAPTKYRTNSYYIVGDSLRFLSEEAETIPHGHVSAEEYEALVASRNANEAQESEVAAPAAPAAAATSPAAATATSAPRKARENREPREHREREPRERKPKADAAAAPAASSEAAATPAAAGEERPARKAFTSCVRIVKVPVDVQLSVVADACGKFGTVTDRYWHKDVDCIITMSKPAEARQIVRLSGRFRIKSFGPFEVEYFYPESA